MIFYFKKLFLMLYEKITYFIDNLIKKISFKNLDLKELPSFEKELAEAYREWQDAKKIFEGVERGLIDYAVFRLNAAERKYMFLLQEAKKNGYLAWRGDENA